jgi:lipid-A-disaccharide synthase
VNLIRSSAGPVAGATGGHDNLIFLIAGEPSGDMLGARLMAALKRQSAGAIRFAGVGGERMAGEGLDSLFPMEELSLFGWIEVLPRAAAIFRRVSQCVEAVAAMRPVAVVTIDAPGFSFRVVQRLKPPRPLRIHLVAPTVWAYRPGRARKIAAFLDHLLVLLPFEPPYFEAVGLPCSFIGHPIVEEGADQGNGPAFRDRHGIGRDATVLCVLPGSRHGETARLLPIFREAVGLLAARFPDLHAAVPTVAAVAEEVAAATATWPVPTTVVRDRTGKYDAFAASDAALAASGTAALELALAGVPMVVAYKLSVLTGWWLRLQVRVKYVNLINLILDRPLIPELLQENCRGARLAEAVGRLLADPEARQRQIEGGREAVGRLGLGGPPPSNRAAETILEIIADAASVPAMSNHGPGAQP